ncbi:hypothetical protein AB3N59_12115 [Leptospira sp. WS92.C1]
MKLHWIKVNNSSHILRIIRDSSSTEEIILETKSYLIHDLMHYCVESVGNFQNAFWGSLEKGKTLADLADRQNPPSDPELQIVESIVGPMQSLWKKSIDEKIVFERLQEISILSDPSLLIQTIHSKMDAVWGKWRSTKFGETMELIWPSKKVLSKNRFFGEEKEAKGIKPEKNI